MSHIKPFASTRRSEKWMRKKDCVSQNRNKAIRKCCRPFRDPPEKEIAYGGRTHNINRLRAHLKAILYEECNEYFANL